MNFKKFIDSNKRKLYKLADKNNLKNSHGKTLIPKDDEWVSENAWENHPTYSKED